MRCDNVSDERSWLTVKLDNHCVFRNRCDRKEHRITAATHIYIRFTVADHTQKEFSGISDNHAPVSKLSSEIVFPPKSMACAYHFVVLYRHGVYNQNVH